MSKDTRVQRFKIFYDQFIKMNPQEFESETGNLIDFDGLSLPEAKNTLKFVLDVLDRLVKSDAVSQLSWHAFTALEGVMQNVGNTYAVYKSSKDQNSYQSFVANLDSLAYHLRMFGAPSLSLGEAELEKTANSQKIELEKLVSARMEVEQLRDEVKVLIAPAVAGSLSQAFTARKDILFWGRVIWGIVALLLGIYSIHATYHFATAVSDALAVLTNPSNAKVNTEVIWLSVALRSVILLPIYAAFGFSFAQYKKERDFEEEYAHKAAVATSLPNYGDLTREPAVRDQIVTGATNVIFSSPTSKNIESEKNEKVLGSVKELIDSFANLLPKRE